MVDRKVGIPCFFVLSILIKIKREIRGTCTNNHEQRVEEKYSKEMLRSKT